MDWVASVIWWHCYPLRFVGAETRADELAEGHVEHRLGRIDRLARLPHRPGRQRPHARARCSPRRPTGTTRSTTSASTRASATWTTSTTWSVAAASGASGCCLDGVFNHVSQDHEIVRTGARRRPGLRGGPLGDVGQRVHDRVRGQPRPRRAELRPPAGGRLHRRRHVLLARPGRRRVAPRRGVRCRGATRGGRSSTGSRRLIRRPGSSPSSSTAATRSSWPRAASTR